MDSDIRVRFQHLKYDFSDKELAQWGSHYFSNVEAGGELRKLLLGKIKHAVSTHDLTFRYDQILSANEIFPESAVADPLADLTVWNEWRRGERSFPYPGVYRPLDIFHQRGKVTSATSVGVIGEIFAGLFAQSYVSRWVLVRPIRRFPDFIFSTGEPGRHAFVESKAFLGKPREPGGDLDGLKNVPIPVLADALRGAVHELSGEPLITVWLAFTEVLKIDPTLVSVCFLELNAPKARRDSRCDIPRDIPAPVLHSVTERFITRSYRNIAQVLAEAVAKARTTDFVQGLEKEEKSEQKFVEQLRKVLVEELTQVHEDEEGRREPETDAKLTERLVKAVLSRSNLDLPPKTELTLGRRFWKTVVSERNLKRAIGDLQKEDYGIMGLLHCENEAFEELIKSFKTMAERLIRNEKELPSVEDEPAIHSVEFVRTVGGSRGELRKVGERRLCLFDLDASDRKWVDEEWKPDWTNACNSFRDRDGVTWWRCSSSALGFRKD